VIVMEPSMNCPNCGSPAARTAQFCPRCGSRLYPTTTSKTRWAWPLAAAAIAAVIVGGFVAFIAVRGDHHAAAAEVTTPSVSSTATPAATTTVTPKAKPKPRPAPKPRTVTTTVARPVVAAPPAPQSAPQTDPWAVVSEYYGDVSSQDYWDAWNLLGPSFQARMGSYDSFVAGYNGTGGQTVSEISEYGDQVTYQLESDNPDGTVQMYQGTATVYDGKMQHADVHRFYGNRTA
jgi:hypothetical protein